MLLRKMSHGHLDPEKVSPGKINKTCREGVSGNKSQKAVHANEQASKHALVIVSEKFN